MKRYFIGLILAAASVLFVAAPAESAGNPKPNEPAIGASVDGLLTYAREHNPELATMRLEAEAAGERVYPAGALPDPRLRTELMDITKAGAQNPTLLPSRVGSTRYTLMQDIPWFGKRDLKREVAEFEAEGAEGRARGTWSELGAKIKIAYAQLYYIHRNETLTREILDIMVRLEKVAQVRYAGGLAAQQDVIRAQVEQTDLRNELIALENEQRGLQARMNALLSRPATSSLAEPVALRALPVPAKMDFVALEDRVRAHNPLLFTEESRIKAAEKNRDLTYKNRYPDFTFGFVPNQFQNSVKQWDLMVELNIPLQQASRHSQEREAEKMLDAARTRRESTANQLLADLSENLAALDAARRMEQLTQTSLLPQAELTFQAALVGYETGKVDFATLLDAQRQIRQAKQDIIKTQAVQQARLADIERLIGDDI